MVVGDGEGQGNGFHSTEHLQFSLGWKITENSKAKILLLWHWHLWLKVLHLLLFCFRYFHRNSLSMSGRTIAGATATRSFSPEPAWCKRPALSLWVWFLWVREFRECGSSFLSIEKRAAAHKIPLSDTLFLMFVYSEALKGLVFG